MSWSIQYLHYNLVKSTSGMIVIPKILVLSKHFSEMLKDCKVSQPPPTPTPFFFLSEAQRHCYFFRLACIVVVRVFLVYSGFSPQICDVCVYFESHDMRGISAFWWRNVI